MAEYGLNTNGAFPVYNTSGNVALYARTLAQQQAKREAEAKALQDDLGKVKIDGVRQADIPEFTTKYNEWKNAYSAIQNERDTTKKIALRRNFDKIGLDLQEIATDSKNLGKGEEELTKMLLNPNIRDKYKEDAVSRFQKSKQLSRNDPNFIRDLSKLEQQVDVSKIMQDLDKEDDEVMSTSRFSDPVERPHVQGNRKGVMIEQQRTIDPQQQALRYASKFDLDPKFRVAIRQLHPELAELPNDQLKAAIVPILVEQRARTEFKPPVFKEDEKPDNWKEKALFREGLVRNRQDAVKPPLYRQDIINRFLDEDQGSGEEIFSSIRSGINTSGGQLNGKIEYRKNKNGTVDIIMPQVLKNDVTIKDGEKSETQKVLRNRTVFTINPKNRESSASILNQILNTYTGEKVPESALLTPQGKKKVPGGQGEKQFSNDDPKKIGMAQPLKTKTSIMKGDISSKAKAAGYTVPEYMELLHKRGVKILE